jgi:lipoprotein NlpI
LAPGTQARAPYAIDPVLNRGVVLEQLGAFDAAIADYNAVLAVSPADPAAWNNRGNARMGKGEYAGAAEDYGKAVALAPAFSFAAANRSIALYAAGAFACVACAVCVFVLWCGRSERAR